MSVATQRTSSEKPDKKKTRIASLGGQDTIRVLNVYVDLILVVLGITKAHALDTHQIDLCG